MTQGLMAGGYLTAQALNGQLIIGVKVILLDDEKQRHELWGCLAHGDPLDGQLWQNVLRELALLQDAIERSLPGSKDQPQTELQRGMLIERDSGFFAQQLHNWCVSRCTRAGGPCENASYLNRCARCMGLLHDVPDAGENPFELIFQQGRRLGRAEAQEEIMGVRN